MTDYGQKKLKDLNESANVESVYNVNAKPLSLSGLYIENIVGSNTSTQYFGMATADWRVVFNRKLEEYDIGVTVENYSGTGVTISSTLFEVEEKHVGSNQVTEEANVMIPPKSSGRVSPCVITLYDLDGKEVGTYTYNLKNPLG